MSTLKVVAANETPKEFSLQAALQEGKKTGVLTVPQQHLCLTIASGVQVEVLREAK
jgi:hypothetical protein